jgi:hypothetical protein
MINRCFAFGMALATLFTVCLSESSPALADQAFQRFIPLLIDLDGWHGKKPDGMSMEMPNNSMATATRDYDRDTSKFHAGVVIGQAAAGALAPTRSAMNFETADGHMITSTVNGLPVTKTYNMKDKSAAILVALGPNALLSFSYSGITENEALQLAEKFDWKAIQAAALSK